MQLPYSFQQGLGYWGQPLPTQYSAPAPITRPQAELWAQQQLLNHQQQIRGNNAERLLNEFHRMQGSGDVSEAPRSEGDAGVGGFGALFGALPAFRGQAGGGMQMEGIGRVEAGNEVPAYQELLRTQASRDNTLANLLSSWFGTTAGLMGTDITSGRQLEGLLGSTRMQTDAQRYGKDRDLEGNKYGADKGLAGIMEQARVSDLANQRTTDAQRYAADQANVPARLQDAFKREQVPMFQELASRIFPSGNGSSNVTGMMQGSASTPSMVDLISQMMGGLQGIYGGARQPRSRQATV